MLSYHGVRTFLHPVRIVRITQNSGPVSGSQALTRYPCKGSAAKWPCEALRCPYAPPTPSRAAAIPTMSTQSRAA